MSTLSQRIVPTLTEVLEVPEWRTTVEEPAVLGLKPEARPEPEPLDEAIQLAIAAAVDAAVVDFRVQLLPRIEAVVRQAMAVRAQDD